MRAPVSRPRPFSRGRAGLLVGDHSLVGDLGLAREFEFGLAHHLVGGPDPGGPGVFFGAPAVISSRRSFLRVSDGCWWA